MGLTMKERQAVTKEYRSRYQKATKKEKRALLDACTRLTGYHQGCKRKADQGSPGSCGGETGKA